MFSVHILRTISGMEIPGRDAQRIAPALNDRRLRPTERMQRSGEFQAVLRGGRAFRDPLLRIHLLENGRELTRLGLVVSRKMGCSVERSRLKRIFREIFREMKWRLPAGLDVVIVPSHRSGGADRAAYTEVFERFAGWVQIRGREFPKGGSP